MSDPGEAATPGAEPAAAPAEAPVEAPTAAPTEAPAEGPTAAPAVDEPRPLGVTVAATGNADVDAVVERLGDADELPVQAHLDVYEDVHRGLRDALTALDENRG